MHALNPTNILLVLALLSCDSSVKTPPVDDSDAEQCTGACGYGGCDLECGDGAWMFCRTGGTCACTNATDLPGGDAAEVLCGQRGGRLGYACGEAGPDVPATCEEQPEAIGDGPRLWCCEDAP